MRMRGIGRAVALGVPLLLASALVLSGCSAPDAAPPAPTRSSTPRATALFASDAEALKAATDAYAAYLRVSDEIAHDGGKNPERIKEVVTGSWAPNELRSSARLAQAGRRMEGLSAFDQVRLQSYVRSVISIYVCADVSGTKFFDAEGADVTPQARKTRLSMVATLSAVSGSKLLLSEYEPWSGSAFC